MSNDTTIIAFLHEPVLTTLLDTSVFFPPSKPPEQPEFPREVKTPEDAIKFFADTVVSSLLIPALDTLLRSDSSTSGDRALASVSRHVKWVEAAVVPLFVAAASKLDSASDADVDFEKKLWHVYSAAVCATLQTGNGAVAFKTLWRRIGENRDAGSLIRADDMQRVCRMLARNESEADSIFVTPYIELMLRQRASDLRKPLTVERSATFTRLMRGDEIEMAEYFVPELRRGEILAAFDTAAAETSRKLAKWCSRRGAFLIREKTKDRQTAAVFAHYKLFLNIVKFI